MFGGLPLQEEENLWNFLWLDNDLGMQFLLFGVCDNDWSLFFVSLAGGYCPATANEFYCEFGCCGNSCCPNEVAIGVGTTFGALVLLIIAGGVFICCIQRRYSPKEEVKFTKDGFTQYEKNPVGIDMTPTVPDRSRRRRSTIAPQPPPIFALKKQEKVEEEEKDVEAGGREDTADDAAPKEPVWTRDASHDHIFIGVPKTYCQ